MRTQRLNLHDTYDVSWTNEMITRDLVQNFYDAVPAEHFHQLVTLTVDHQQKCVVLTGPNVFATDYLWRIGVGTKTGRPDEFAGGFGEGFAIAILQIIRNGRTAVSTTVGTQQLTFRLEPITIGDSTIRELVCDVQDLAPPDALSGTQLVLTDCPPSLCLAFEESRHVFRYPHNPLFGDLLGDDPRQGLFIYRSTRKDGAIFYRRQKRAAYDLPFIVCHDRATPDIHTGRDRQDLTRREVKKLVDKTVAVLPKATMEALVLTELQPYWEKGHPLLSALATAWTKKFPTQALVFPEDYCAKSGWDADQTAKRLGKTLCANYMASFGMLSAWKLSKTLEEGQIRAPEGVEVPRFTLLVEAFSAIMGKALPGWQYQVFVPTDEKSKLEGHYHNKTIFLTPERLAGAFPEALATFLHEACHPYGLDGDPRFSDRLTWALHQVIVTRALLDDLEQQWIHAGPQLPMTLSTPSTPAEPHTIAALRTWVVRLEERIKDLEDWKATCTP